MGFISFFCKGFHVHFQMLMLLIYEKVNYYEIRNSIIKTAVSFDRKHFLVLFIFPKFYF